MRKVVTSPIWACGVCGCRTYISTPNDKRTKRVCQACYRRRDRVSKRIRRWYGSNPPVERSLNEWEEIFRRVDIYAQVLRRLQIEHESFEPDADLFEEARDLIHAPALSQQSAA